MKTSPTNTTRHVSTVVAHPPTMGPTAIPAPATPADDRVGGLAAGSLEVAGDQGRERREDQRRADALKHRPTEGEHGPPDWDGAVRAEPQA